MYLLFFFVHFNNFLKSLLLNYTFVFFFFFFSQFEYWPRGYRVETTVKNILANESEESSGAWASQLPQRRG